MASYVSTVTPPPVPVDRIHIFEFTDEEVKALINVTGRVGTDEINGDIWEGSSHRSKITSKEWFDLYKVLLKSLGRII